LERTARSSVKRERVRDDGWVSGTDRVDVGQAGWCWRRHGVLLREGEVLAPPERTAANTAL
jgi:hypothetical protein